MPRYRSGLANALIVFLGSLFAAALIIAALDGPFNTIIGQADTLATSSAAATGIGFIETFWILLPFVVVVLLMIQLIGAATTEANV